MKEIEQGLKNRETGKNVSERENFVIHIHVQCNADGCVILCCCLHMSKYLIYGVLEGMWYFAPGSKSSSLLFTAGEIPWYLHLQGI